MKTTQNNPEMTVKERIKRAKEMKALHDQGYSLNKIGQMQPRAISRQRVQELIRSLDK